MCLGALAWDGSRQEAGRRFPQGSHGSLRGICSARHCLIVTAGFSALQGFFRKGKVLLEMGQRAEALLVWEHCLTLSPHFHPARREMQKVRGPYSGGVLCPHITQGDALVL